MKRILSAIGLAAIVLTASCNARSTSSYSPSKTINLPTPVPVSQPKVKLVSNSNSNAVQEWTTLLRGKTLLQISSDYDSYGTGSRSKQHLNLCSNGQFLFSSFHSYIVSGMSDSWTDEATGNWQIVEAQGTQAILEFNVDGGGVEQSLLEVVNGELYRDGEVNSIVANEVCS